jgi:hypothetical protein
MAIMERSLHGPSHARARMSHVRDTRMHLLLVLAQVP